MYFSINLLGGYFISDNFINNDFIGNDFTSNNFINNDFTVCFSINLLITLLMIY